MLDDLSTGSVANVSVDVRRSVADPGVDARVNVAGTAIVLEAARQASARVVLASTSAVFGDPAGLPLREVSAVAPLSPYGAGKYAAEVYVESFRRLYGLSTLCLRLANVYGRVRTRTAAVFGDRLQSRDYIYVGDVAAAFAAAGRSDVSGVLNVGTGVETSLLELAAQLKLATRHAPARARDIERSCLDPSALQRELGRAAETPLSEGLRRTLTAAAA